MKKFNFLLEDLPDDGEYFGYEDFRLDQPDRGLFYIGIGSRRRVKIPERDHNRGHRNIANTHGVLRKVVKVFSSIEEMNTWEISRIKEVRELGLTLVNKADGGEGTRGLMPCRNLETGEVKVLRIKDIPEGWVHASTGMVPCHNILTGESKNFSKDAIPDGWQTFGKGMIQARNTVTGEIKRILSNEMSKEWVGINKKRATYKNPRTGETAMFYSNQVPEGWVHIFKGLVSCINLQTGEKAAFPKDAIPLGWSGVTKGKVAMKNPLTGETGSFYKDEVPQGWVGMNSGNKKTNSTFQKVQDIITSNPDAPIKKLIELCVESGINKSTSGVYCRKLKRLAK